ncbi:Fic family protein [Mucilaginibacter sp. KACC 22773]|uniref:Fic family protein n=1 Tax=Mucilaginibacter sp. KACC 22773 TaxID=3025671 RepID=UPI002366886A|nr:Fic family protein [Mucilaginibacter sp. KACC 22773]WDF78462.1 Fic family protein [Mucilaginibacter sp. KACC 22773]
MSFIEKLQEIDSLQAAIQERGPIPVSLLNKINYKLRLEWNYTSNSMEGNSLTKRETRTVMVNNLEVNGKPIKDVMEIRSHDKVITTIMKMGKGELNISESRIKEIHKGIMYEEDAEKLKYVGQWKSTDNYMLNFDGERYDFTPHAEVPERMHELVNWINSEKEKIERSKKDAAHPALLAFKFQIDYLTIHPFYDGNGRTARILSNLILISYGFPPLYIKEDEKQSYYRYLTDIQSGGGEPDLFYEFMAGLLLRSLQITIDTLDGRDVEEEDDIDKEIALFKRSLDKDKERTEIYNWDSVSKIITESGIPLFQKLKTKLSQFDELFHLNENRIIFNTDKSPSYDLLQRHGGYMVSTALFPESLRNWLSNPMELNGHIISFGMEYLFKGYKFAQPYDLPVFMRFSFEEYTYSISYMIQNNDQEDYFGDYRYDQLIDSGEINNIVNEITKMVLNFIKGDKIE